MPTVRTGTTEQDTHEGQVVTENEVPTLWQRMWRSPWFFLSLMVLCGLFLRTDVGWWRVLDWLLLFYWGFRFAQAAAKRWGKP